MEVLELFAAFTETEKFRKLADEYGFNPSLLYEPAFSIPAGKTLVQAQELWKEKKDAGRPISSVVSKPLYCNAWVMEKIQRS